MKNAVASNWVAETCVATDTGFTLKGTSKGYTSFSKAFDAGTEVFYSVHDSNGNREAGYATFDGTDLTDRHATATLLNGVYSKTSVTQLDFTGELTIACTFNAVAFNVLWKALDAIDPDGDGSINIPPELIEGLIDMLDTKAEQADLDQEVKDRIDGDKALQDQIDALDPDGDLKVDWSEIEGKPSEFPPTAHNQGWDTITGKPSEYPPSSHGHEISDVNGLQDALNSAGGTPDWNDITGKPTEFPPEAHNQDWSTITNTPSEYPPAAHGHEQSDVDGLEDRLTAIEGSISSGGGFVEAPNDGKLYGRQSEAWAEVVIPAAVDTDWADIQNKPAEFPPSAHNHAWDQITGKPSEFPPAAHNHDGVYQPVGDYLTDAAGSIASDGKQYTRQNGGWAEVAPPPESLWKQSGDDIYYSDGNVGIGIDSPSHRLNVASGEEGIARFQGAGNFNLDLSNPGNTRFDFKIGSANGEYSFSNSAKELVRVDEDGNVGVGTTPSYRFQLNEDPPTAFGTPMLQVGGSGFQGGGYYSIGLGYSVGGSRPPAEIAAVSQSPSGNTTADIVFGTRTVTTDTAVVERMRIHSEGDVEIIGTLVAGAVTAGGYGNASPGSAGLLNFNDTPVLAWDSAQMYPNTPSGLTLGTVAYPFKDGHFSGTIYGDVDDVPDHVKSITPTQIANWDAGTGGGGGATTDGRISDTQITNWDSAYGWGNHASAGYESAGTAYSKAESDAKYELKGAGGGGTTYTAGNGISISSDVIAMSGSFTGNFTASGNITAYSDEKLKESIDTAPTGVIEKLRGVEFNWKESGRKDCGVIAQEVAKQLPHLTYEHSDGNMSVNYNGLVGYLIEEVKALRAEVEALKG